MDIFLINHPEVYNPDKVCFGQSELPLTENFTADFSWISESLPPLKKENNICYSSPLRRSTKLANFLCGNEEYITDKRLADLNFGNWEMKEWPKISPVQLTKWQDDFVNYKIPKGESLSQVFDRVDLLYQEILLSKKEQIFVVAHANIIKCFLCNVMGLSLQNVLDFEISNSSISKIYFDEELLKDKVVFMNYSPALTTKKFNKIL